MAEQKENMKKLANVITREFSVAFCKLWSDASVMNFKQYFGENRNILIYVKSSENEPVRVWQDFNETVELMKRLAQFTETNMKNISKESEEKLNELRDYLVKKKKLTSMDELIWFGKNFTELYTLVMINFAICELEFNEEIKKGALAYREKTQDLIYNADEVIQETFQSLSNEGNMLREIITIEEFKDYLNNNLDLKKIEERKVGWVMINSVVTQLNKLPNFLQQNKLEFENIETNESNQFEGRVASRGIAEGPVKIIMLKKEFSKINKGDILVTSMTTPEFTVLMEKISAVVTDEGGIACHAAIISREFGKPCIVGTQVATKILNDGDIVRVDAEKGIVKILKKHIKND